MLRQVRKRSAAARRLKAHGWASSGRHVLRRLPLPGKRRFCSVHAAKPASDFCRRDWWRLLLRPRGEAARRNHGRALSRPAGRSLFIGNRFSGTSPACLFLCFPFRRSSERPASGQALLPLSVPSSLPGAEPRQVGTGRIVPPPEGMTGQSPGSRDRPEGAREVLVDSGVLVYSAYFRNTCAVLGARGPSAPGAARRPEASGQTACFRGGLACLRVRPGRSCG